MRSGKYSEEREQAHKLGMSFCRFKKVAANTSVYMHKELGDFQAWANQHHLDLSHHRKMDTAVEEYMDHLFFSGHGSDRGDKLLAALARVDPLL